MPTSSRSESLCVYSCPQSMFRCWSLRGQGSCPGKNLEKKPAQGALPKSRPLENPPAAPPEVLKIFRLAIGEFIEKSLKNTVSLRASAHTGVAIRSSRPPWLPLWGSCHEVTERVNTPSPPLRGTSPIGRGKWPSSVTAAPCHLYIMEQLPLAIVRF